MGKLLVLLSLLGMAFSTTSCKMFEGAGEDIEDAGDSVEDVFD